MSSLEVQRRFYARFVTAKAGISDPRIIEAFATVRREDFLGKGPWTVPLQDGSLSTETDDPVVLYQDILVAIDAARNVNNGEPSLHARCLGAVMPQPGEVAIQVGTGTGYYTALLAHLVGPSGHIHGFEIDPDLAARSARNLAHLSNVTVYPTSALEGALPSADLIYVCAGATYVPQPWLDALLTGGRLILPLTTNEGPGCMLLVRRLSETVFAARILCVAYFIACMGARDDAQSRILAAALDRQDSKSVRSLRRDNHHDQSAWCIGQGWWLSTAAPDLPSSSG